MPSKDPLALPRQTKLQANSEAIERWHRKLFRAATELKRLTEQRKRLLKPRPPGGKLKLHEPIGFGGAMPGGHDGLNDDMPF